MIVIADAVAAAVLHLIIVHGPTGQEIDVNITEISSIRRPEAYENEPGTHFAKGTKCILAMSNGKLINTLEDCAEIIKKISEVNK
jgi:hypothetical protein